MREAHIALTGIVIAAVIAISIFVRMGTSSREEAKETVRAESTDKLEVPAEEEMKETVRLREDWTEKQERFRRWCLEHTAVTRIEFESDWQISVTLAPEKYTTVENVEAVAENLAGHYKRQSGYPDIVVVTIWSVDGSEYWKGFWE
jgi:hypothetical protein